MYIICTNFFNIRTQYEQYSTILVHCMYFFCTLIVQYSHKIWDKYLYNICRIFVEYLHKSCTIFLQYLWKICLIYVQYLYNICMRFVQYLYNIWMIYMQNICTIISQYFFWKSCTIFTIFLQYLHKICTTFRQFLCIYTIYIFVCAQYLCNIIVFLWCKIKTYSTQ